MLLSFDDSPIAYYMVGNLLIFVAGILSLTPFFKPELAQRKTFLWGFIFLNIFVMIMMRMPVIVYNHELNPDESWMIVGAMTLSKEPIFWKSVDGGTSGPFNFYILVFFNTLFSQPYDYISARIVGILLMAGSAVLFFFSVRRLFTSQVAFISLFVITTFLGLTRSADFVHYSSEHVSIFLISILCYQFAKIYTDTSPSYLLLFSQGFLAALTIFAKLQATPIAFFCIFLTTLLLCVKKYQISSKQFFKYMLSLIAGGSVFLVGFFTLAIYYGVFYEILDFYFVNNLKYSGSSSTFFNFKVFYESIFYGFTFILRLVIIIFLVWFILKIVSLKSSTLSFKQFLNNSMPSLFMVCLLISSIFSAYKTGFLFQHYLLFLIFPAGFLLADSLLLLQHFVTTTTVKIILSTLIVLIFLKNITTFGHNPYVSAGKPQRPMPLSDVSSIIMKFAKSNESIIVWGTGGNYYLETQLGQGVRWNNTLWGMYSDDARSFLHQHFLAGLKKSSAPVFIDSYTLDAPILRRDRAGHETVAELRNYIKENYVMVAEINQHRIYVRNDRFLNQNSIYTKE